MDRAVAEPPDDVGRFRLESRTPFWALPAGIGFAVLKERLRLRPLAEREAAMKIEVSDCTLVDELAHTLRGYDYRVIRSGANELRVGLGLSTGGRFECSGRPSSSSTST